MSQSSMDAGVVADRWLAWFNQGDFAEAERFYADDAEFQRLGMQEPVRGPRAITAFLREEKAALPGRRIDATARIAEGDSAAIEGICGGFGERAERFETPYLRLGPILTFLAVRDGLIVQDHTYLAAAPTRGLRPVGLETVRYVESPQPLHPLLAEWEDKFNKDPVAMMLDCYTPDATVAAMFRAPRPYDVEGQIARERRSHEIFPGRRIAMKRWLSTSDAIAVEFTWAGRHRDDAARNLSTISACFLRLRDGLIYEDHTYKPTGAA